MRPRIAIFVLVLLALALVRALVGALSGQTPLTAQQKSVGTPIKVCLDKAESDFKSAIASNDHSAVLAVAGDYDIDPRLLQSPPRWSDHVSSVTDFCERRLQLQRAAHMRDQSTK